MTRQKRIKGEPVPSHVMEQAIEAHTRTLAHLITTAHLQARALNETLTALRNQGELVPEHFAIRESLVYFQPVLDTLNGIVSDQGNAIGRKELQSNWVCGND